MVGKCVTDAYTYTTKKFKDLLEFAGLKLSHERMDLIRSQILNINYLCRENGNYFLDILTL